MSSQPPQPHLPTPCPECQGQRIWAFPHVNARGYSGHFDLVYAQKEGFFPTDKQVEVVAALCLKCGYTAFYASDVEQVRVDYKQHPEWFVR